MRAISKKYARPIASTFFISFLGTGGIVLLLQEVAFFGSKILFSTQDLNITRALFCLFGAQILFQGIVHREACKALCRDPPAEYVHKFDPFR
jgi:hypothetical protein